MTKRLKKGNRLILLLKFTIILVLFGIIATIMLFLNYKFLVVKNLEINLVDINCTDSKSLSEESELLGQSMLMVNKLKVEQNLKEKYLCIKKINMVKHLPDKIEMDVFGRDGAVNLVQLDPKISTPSATLINIATPSAQELIGSKSYTIDEEGINFSESTVDGLPMVYSFGEGNNWIKEVIRIIDKLKTFGLDTKEGYLTTYTLVVNTYPKIIFNLSQNLDAQLASLQLILEQAKIGEEMLEFIDLRFDKPVIRIAPKDK